MDTSRMDRGELRQQFGMVLQDAWLFDGTIAENIAYSYPEATRDEIVATTRAAQVDDFFMRRSAGGLRHARGQQCRKHQPGRAASC
ncbi:MAG: hypothetical protein V8Q95_05330 [Collinsella sp.]